MKLSKNTLNILGTTFGAIAGISGILGSNGYVEAKLAGTVASVATLALGIVTQSPSKDTADIKDEISQIRKEIH